MRLMSILFILTSALFLSSIASAQTKPIIINFTAPSHSSDLPPASPSPNQPQKGPPRKPLSPATPDFGPIPEHLNRPIIIEFLPYNFGTAPSEPPPKKTEPEIIILTAIKPTSLQPIITLQKLTEGPEIAIQPRNLMAPLIAPFAPIITLVLRPILEEQPLVELTLQPVEEEISPIALEKLQKTLNQIAAKIETLQKTISASVQQPAAPPTAIAIPLEQRIFSARLITDFTAQTFRVIYNCTLACDLIDYNTGQLLKDVSGKILTGLQGEGELTIDAKKVIRPALVVNGNLVLTTSTSIGGAATFSSSAPPPTPLCVASGGSASSFTECCSLMISSGICV